MARNVDKVYLSPAIPRDSRLWQSILTTHKETGVTESNLLVLFASEYVRMMATGMIMPTASPDVATPMPSLTSDADFDSFGEPDE